MLAENCASTRYSRLDEINRGNVESLQVAFRFLPDVARGQEPVPVGGGSTFCVFPLLH
jgi:glucose dehydrogenase